MNAVRISSEDAALPIGEIFTARDEVITVHAGVRIARLHGGPHRQLHALVAPGATYALVLPAAIDASAITPPMLLANCLSGASLAACCARDLLIVMIPGTAFERVPGRWQLAANPVTPGVHAVEDDAAMRHLCLALATRSAESAARDVIFERSLVSAMLAHFLCRYCPSTTNPAAGPGLHLEGWQLRLAEEAMLANLDQPLRVKAIAARCGVSVVHFSRAFRRSTNDTPSRWILRRRVERACALLQEGTESIADIALTCGFSDQSHMTRSFATLLGTTPGAWRSHQRLAQTP